MDHKTQPFNKNVQFSRQQEKNSQDKGSTHFSNETAQQRQIEQEYWYEGSLLKQKIGNISAELLEGVDQGKSIGSTNQSLPARNVTQANLFKEYMKYMWSQQSRKITDQKFDQPQITLDNFEIFQTLQKKLQANNQFQKCPTYTTQLLIHSILPTKYNEIVRLDIQLGFYKTYLTILNFSSLQKEQSPFHNCASPSKSGGFGRIFTILSQKEAIAIKCIKTNQRNKFVVKILKQWFFMKLFSELKIGPKLKKLLGFDMILGCNCMQFAMELCSQLKFSLENQQKLIQILKIFHTLNIVHKDINPQNIMWSNEFQSPVFIDFGGTQFISQSIGQRTYTSFMGTTGYISAEMIQTLTSKNGYVDLYYNDMYGLCKSLRYLGFHPNCEEPLIQKISFVNSIDLVFCMIKCQLYEGDFEDLEFLLSKFRKLCCGDIFNGDERIAEFLVQLKPNEDLKKIYQKLDPQVKILKKFIKLKDIYQNELEKIIENWISYEFKEEKFLNQIAFYKMLNLNYGTFTSIEQEIQMATVSKAKSQKSKNDDMNIDWLMESSFKVKKFKSS